MSKQPITNKVNYTSWTRTLRISGTGSRADAITSIFYGCETKGEIESIFAELNRIAAKKLEQIDIGTILKEGEPS